MATYRVRELREAQGLSRDELARRADVTYAYIRKLEEGNPKRPEHGALSRVAVALGVPVDALLEGGPLPAELPGTADMPPFLAATVQRLGRYLTQRDWELVAAYLEGLAAQRAERRAAHGYEVPEAAEDDSEATSKQTA